VQPPVRVVFVCSGNICRSPTAEVVLTSLARASGRSELVRVSSAGTGGWHVGGDMDPRSRQTLVDAGYGWPRHRARQFTAADFADQDVVVALDSGHYAELRDLAEDADDPAAARDAIVLLRDFDPDATDDHDVADPYYGGSGGFTDVLGQVERSCAALLDAIDDNARTGGLSAG
jgi:protein-tyrosine phosphatase